MNYRRFFEFPPEWRNRIIQHHEKQVEQIGNTQQSYGSMFIRNLVFMNGGALVAILSAIAALKANKIPIEWTISPMRLCVCGLVFAILLNGCRYLRSVYVGERYLAYDRRFIRGGIDYDVRERRHSDLDKIDLWCFWGELALGTLGLACFILGFIFGIWQLT